MNQATNKHPRPFGRGTIAMIVGIVAFGVYAYATQPPHLRTRRIEADSTGRLSAVERSTPMAARQTPLWKPEPDLLLRYAKRLEITQAQLKRIELIARAWTASRIELEKQIRAITAPLERAKTLRVSGEGAFDPGRYSAISQEFERARMTAWSNALAALSESQQTELFQIVQEETK